MSWSDYIREAALHRTYVKTQYEINAEKIKLLKNHKLTKRIFYSEMPEPFDYVDSLYPEANVRQAFVYNVNRYALQDAGYGGVGGFYDIPSRNIFVTDFVAIQPDEIGSGEFTIDEVVCHELIHYAANFNQRASSRTVEEEIAYGKSIGYLRQKRRSDDFIIRKNMMPYLLSCVNREPIYRQVLIQSYGDAIADISEEGFNILLKDHQHTIDLIVYQEAYQMGKRFISLYGDKIEPEVVEFNQKELNVDDEL